MTTKILGEAVGIQWQGIQDRTQGQSSSNGVPLLIGSFKRGRMDQPMIIYNGNIKSELGYEPNNADYIVVQSMLDMGVPNVNVLRVSHKSNLASIPESTPEPEPEHSSIAIQKVNISPFYDIYKDKTTEMKLEITPDNATEDVRIIDGNSEYGGLSQLTYDPKTRIIKAVGNNVGAIATILIRWGTGNSNAAFNFKVKP